jgi:hypothetical protein
MLKNLDVVWEGERSDEQGQLGKVPPRVTVKRVDDYANFYRDAIQIGFSSQELEQLRYFYQPAFNLSPAAGVVSKKEDKK